MLDKYDLPKNLLTVIADEKIDFSVKAKRNKPIKNSIGILLFGTVWTAFTSIFVFAFLWPLFIGEEVHFTSNDIPTVASPDNLEPIILPAIIIGVFVLIGIIMLGYGIYSLFKKGGYFVGTPLRMISYQNGTVRSIDWEQFSGDIEVNGNEVSGNISLQMRTGKMVSSKNNRNRYVPDTIYISGIPNVYQVEQICRKRIKENDPTPPIK
ncbi:MAG: hypothetical protein OQJ81_04580 [Melioribacteraceae bacterium]|jgi:hypothetical protein|nr:hypothetical protein [Melioribacteraceae bacterium]